jgi:hypothetical protein
MQAVREPNGHESTFTVVAASILHYDSRAFKDQGRERKVEIAFPEVCVALPSIP